MKLDKLIEITKGELIERGEKDEFFRATFFPEKVEEGDVCFVENLNEAKLAARNKACVLVYSENFIDKNDFSDISQVKVKDLKRSSFLLIGAVLSEDEASFELLSFKVMTYFKMILTQKNSVEFIPKDYKRAFDLILGSDKRVFVGCDETMLKTIREKEYYTTKAPGHIVSSDSLFRTTFKINKYIYQYKKLPLFHLDDLRRAVSLCEEYELSYSLDKINYTKHFKPFFPEGEPFVREVMKNDRVIILSDNLKDILDARGHAVNIGQWMAKCLVIVPPKTKVEGIKNPLFYRSSDDVLEAIKSKGFNYLFVYADDPSFESLIYKMSR